MKRTAEEIAQADIEIARLWSEGRTIPEIADSLGVTISAVSTRITALRKRGVDLEYRDNNARKVVVSRFPSKEERDARRLNMHEIRRALG